MPAPAIPTCAVRVRLYDQNGQAVGGASITAQLDRYEIHDGLVVPQRVEAVTDQYGEAILSLWPNALGSQSSSYKIKVQPSDSKGYSTIAIVPDVETAELDQIAQLPELPGKADFHDFFEQAQGLASDLVDAANTSKTAAQAAQTAAAGSATGADTSADDAAAHAAAALASSQSATASANAAEASRVNAAASEGVASAAATSASDSSASALASKNAAATSEGNASASAASAATSATAAQTAQTAAEAARDLAQQYSEETAPTISLPGDANLTTGRHVRTVAIYSAPITAPRAITLNATDPVNGDTVHATRSAASTGADLLDFGGLKYLNPGQWAQATRAGGAWVLTGYGSL
ncbi:hypothetical protein LJR296_001455 [Cupriavidus necator]|uniref:hypothetical protein n=1 Tax=Cupriavidus necator TaxID=106590 RepID=UPI003ECC643C